MAISADTPCPCGSKQKYKRCCRIFHRGELPANTLLLMKSRYAAYAAGEAQYIMQSTHPEAPSYQSDTSKWQSEIVEFCQSTEFKGLKIIKFEDGSEEAFVTFYASLQRAKANASFSERSRFKKLNGRWLYFDGQFL